MILLVGQLCTGPRTMGGNLYFLKFLMPLLSLTNMNRKKNEENIDFLYEFLQLGVCLSHDYMN